MTDIFLPPQLVPSRMSWSIDDFTVADESAVTGATQTSELYGTRRWRCRMDFDFLDSRDGTLQAYDAFIAALRGKANRVWVRDYARRQRGSFSAPELLTNSTFESGTTGWGTYNSSISAAGRVLRATSLGTTAGFGVSRTGIAVTQYAPHAFRAAFMSSRLFTSQLIAEVSSNSVYASQTLSADSGLATAADVMRGTTANITAWHNSDGGPRAARRFDVSMLSLSRCALVDGGPNALTYSDQLDNAAWTATGLAARGANVTTAPDGTSTADSLQENSSAGAHGIQQAASRTSAAADVCSYGYFKRIDLRNVTLTAGNDASNLGAATFDLSNGTIASGPTNFGTATNTRAFVVSVGNGWYFCCVVARVPAAATMRQIVYLTNGTSTSYTGNGTSSIAGWRVGMALSSTPTRGVQTVASSVASGTSQPGTGIYLKGLPASTSGLLLPGDGIEIQGERKIVTASLDSDAAGLGYLQFEPAMRVAAADNAPVIIGDPLCRMRLASSSVGTEYEPGLFGKGQIELVEA